jgi:hypothetical protein
MPKQTYVAELAPVAAPLPRDARIFVLFEAETDQQAVDTVNALGMVRGDRAVQVDLYLRHGNALGRKLWSGLHKPPRHRPQLSVVA